MRCRLAADEAWCCVLQIVNSIINGQHRHIMFTISSHINVCAYVIMMCVQF